MRLESKRHRIAEKITWDKHVVAAGWLTWDVGSIPTASTIFFGVFIGVFESSVKLSGMAELAELVVNANQPKLPF